MISLTSALPQWSISKKRVLLRADFNVPIQHGKVLNDFRLHATKPTIDYLIKHNAHIIIATHIGRPMGHDDRLSTKWLLPWFKEHGYSPVFVEDIAHINTVIQSHSLVLLENLRFFAGEKQRSDAFAQSLAATADYFVQDAFGSLHRSDASITLVPLHFDPSKRTIGFLVEQELRMLNTLLEKPKKPFVLILGGGKVVDKIPFIQQLLPLVDTVILGPAIASTFLYANNILMGASLVEPSAVPLVHRVIKEMAQRNIKLILPEDLLVAQGSLKGSLNTTSVNTLHPDDVAVSIGPVTQKIICHEISQAGTVFYNGLMGSLQRPQTLEGALNIFKAMAESDAYTIIAGGDSVAAAKSAAIGQGISYFSTGGGATLSYISGNQLPGLFYFAKTTNVST